jgi:DNA-binding NtrC family response regulator
MTTAMHWRSSSEFLFRSGYEVITCKGVPDAVKILDKHRVDLVITDLKMPKHSGFDLIRYVSENFHDTAVIMITGYPSIEGAVEAIKSVRMIFWPSHTQTMN